MSFEAFHPIAFNRLNEIIHRKLRGGDGER